MASFVVLAFGLCAPDASLAQGPSPEARAVIQGLSPDERQKFFAMPQDERRAFIQKKLAEKGGAPAATAQGPAPKGGAFKGGKGKSGQRRPPPFVEIADVTREPLIQTYPVTGRFVASTKSIIASEIKGRVAEVLVDVGDRVKKGAILARLDDDRLKLEADLRAAAVIQARAKWHNAQAQVKLLEQELTRLERLKKSAAFSQARFDDKQQEVVKARTAVDEAAAMLQSARASRDLARIDRRDAEIKAPFDGAVIVRHTAPGAYINAGAPVVTLLDDSHLEVEADVPSVRIAGVKPASVVDVRLSDNTVIKAKVRAVVPDENPLTRTQAVRLVPQLNGNRVVPNQSVVVMVPRGEQRMVVAVPKDAISERSNGKTVFVFSDGRVRPAVVGIGESFGSKFEVLSGLQPGQKVVVRGNENLRPGQPVRIKRGGNGASAAGGRGPGGPGRGIVGSLDPEERQKFFAMNPEERRAFIAKKRAEQPAGAAGGGGGGRGIVSQLSPEERQKFFAMSPEERRDFIAKKRQEMQGN